jgi:hypothetical protein
MSIVNKTSGVQIDVPVGRQVEMQCNHITQELNDENFKGNVAHVPEPH